MKPVCDSRDGVVAALTADGHAWVEFGAQHACGGCSQRSGCGESLISTGAVRRFRIAVGPAAQVGDIVTVSVPEGRVSRAAALAYGLPLVAALAGAGAITALGGGEAWAIVGLIAGLGAGWLLLRWLERSGRLVPPAAYVTVGSVRAAKGNIDLRP